MNRFDDTGESGAGPGDGLEGFGFHLPDDTWLERARSAARRADLGRIGRYEILEEISRGAQGVVYRARQPNTNRTVALKRVAAGRFASPAARARFIREIKTAAALSHPNIVTVYGTEMAGGQPVLAMEWIDGPPIDVWAGERRGSEAGVGAILGAYLRVCQAVRYAHQRGVIHRDLKPTNILIDRARQPHVLDFGLAKLVSSGDSSDALLTMTHDFVGTPAYAAPEQARSDHAAVVGPSRAGQGAGRHHPQGPGPGSPGPLSVSGRPGR